MHEDNVSYPQKALAVRGDCSVLFSCVKCVYSVRTLQIFIIYNYLKYKRKSLRS